MKKTILVAASILAGATAAHAEFWVAQDQTSKHCSVVEQRPAGGAMMVGEGKTYATRAEAEAAMRAATMCADRQATGTTNFRAMAQVPGNAATIKKWYNQNIYDPSGAKIGEVDDVLVGSDAKIAALVVGVGGFLGIGEKHVLVSPEAVQTQTKNNNWYLTMAASKDELRNAPGVKMDTAKSTWLQDSARDANTTSPAPAQRPVTPTPAPVTPAPTNR